jgi:FkbM family methyltransferase
MDRVSNVDSDLRGMNSGSYLHHSAFGQFSRWQGTVPSDFIVNFLGVLSRVAYFDPYLELSRQYPADRNVTTEYPPFNEEYFEWIDILEAVLSAKHHFTMVDLGAGFGRWVVNAAVALRQLSDTPYTLVAVEAEPTHFQWMIQHLADNSLDASDFRLIQGAVAETDGKVGFHVGESEFGKPADWYGQHIGGPALVDAVSLSTVLQPLGTVDLIDMDIQGAELRVLEAAAQEVDDKVKRIHIGTHAPDIEQGLHSLFGRLGWRCLRSFSSGTSADTEWGAISFQDGVQTWLNPSYLDGSQSETMILSEKLRSSRREGERLWQELNKMRKEKNQVYMIDPDSLFGRVLSIGARMRDRIAPIGTRRRKIIQSVVKKN